MWICLTRATVAYGTSKYHPSFTGPGDPVYLNIQHAIAMSRMGDDEMTRVDFAAAASSGNEDEGMDMECLEYFVVERPEFILSKLGQIREAP
jgi:hypothetical protein